MSGHAGLAAELRQAGAGRGDLVGLALADGVGLGLAAAGGWSAGVETENPATLVGGLDKALRPRWVVWSPETSRELVQAGVRMATCWDLAAVHRLLAGGWHADAARVWAHARGLDVGSIPDAGPPDLFSPSDDGDPEGAVGARGYLRAGWVAGGWSRDPVRLRRWAQLALEVALGQRRALGELPGSPNAPGTARAESTAELLCCELGMDGLPVDRDLAEDILAGIIGPRPRTPAQVAEARSARDARVLRHLPAAVQVDLRSPAQVRSLLGRLGVAVTDTRAWRLRELRHAHPLIDDLLEWRKVERVATTYGYGWLDAHLGDDGRLRGIWTGSDGAAGRMTASAGLHNMPVEMRAAVVAEPGSVLVRADLGQVEPRVLAAVSGDAALARACDADDLYAPVAAQLGVDRETAKRAVLGAMYGQTTGHGAQVLPRLKAAYRTAMAYLEEADGQARAGHDLRTYGGRKILMGPLSSDDQARVEPAARAAARGRYGRNAMVQGAAAELFKVWAVTVRARGEELGARIVLCLHDELLVQVGVEGAGAARQMVEASLQEAVRRWAPQGRVRFVADTSVTRRWSDAKAPRQPVP